MKVRELLAALEGVPPETELELEYREDPWGNTSRIYEAYYVDNTAKPNHRSYFEIKAY